MEGLFREEIETRQVDKFFACEMGRQIHRYIKRPWHDTST
mgnify:CR=1 FL=1